LGGKKKRGRPQHAPEKKVGGVVKGQDKGGGRNGTSFFRNGAGKEISVTNKQNEGGKRIQEPQKSKKPSQGFHRGEKKKSEESLAQRMPRTDPINLENRNTNKNGSRKKKKVL